MARLVFLLRVTSVAVVTIWFSDGLTFHNKWLPGHVMSTVRPTDWFQCLEECNKRVACLSYDYFPLENLCQLNNFGFENRCHANENLVAAQGWIHHTLVKSEGIKTDDKSSFVNLEGDLTANFSCFKCEIFADGTSLGNGLGLASSFSIPFGTRVVAVRAWKRGANPGLRGGNSGYRGRGLIGSFSNGLVTNERWKCHVSTRTLGWTSPEFDDTMWPPAMVLEKGNDIPREDIHGILKAARWIWTSTNYPVVDCRRKRD
ncbi:uncharacterized protein [Montipora foliosa]|uniref:uncharacterized protein n=1 Tax=Montipora foliosa TaxID=591990 RepID=UPI0035F13200